MRGRALRDGGSRRARGTNANTRASRLADVHRDASNGHIPEWAPAFEYRTKKAPKPSPAPSARKSGVRLRETGSCGESPASDEISATEPTARATPNRASADGRSPNVSPHATGTIAETTAVIGAT